MSRNNALKVKVEAAATPDAGKGKAPEKVAVLMDKLTVAVIGRLDAIEKSLGSTYGLVSGVGADLLSGKIKPVHIRTWVAQHDQSEEGKRRIIEVIRQIGDYVRDETAERSKADGGKVTLRKADSKDVKKFKELNLKQGELNLLPPRFRPASHSAPAAEPGTDPKAMAEMVRLWLNDKDTKPAMVAAFREAITPTLKAHKFF